ncbi:MAG: Gfo/Idh/MocA family oxidoreductase [Spirochaetales bacterium]|nr:Gfo/Idh/MocA family oxidoreductase [Spirochaetales bacterium]
MSNKIQWGIIATGTIANKFAADFSRVGEGELAGIGSRFTDKAKSFAKKYGIKRFYGSYRELAEDPAIDAIYIATPNHLHHDNTLMCLDAGKSVLCEKPFTLNKDQTARCIDTAVKRKAFLMEAMWMRFNPAITRLMEYLSKSSIGDIVGIRADFGFSTPFDPASRLFNPGLGGGALLDVGVYTISLAVMILGKPLEIKSMAAIGKSGVDEENSVVLRHKGDRLSVLTSGFRANTSREADIYGTEGNIKLHAPWHRAPKLTLFRNESRKTIIVRKDTFAEKSQGLNNQVDHVIGCMKKGYGESPVMPWSDSLLVMEIMDEIRTQWGLRYPQEA